MASRTEKIQDVLRGLRSASPDIIGASVVRAQRKHPVRIYWIEFNINHEQNGIAPSVACGQIRLRKDLCHFIGRKIVHYRTTASLKWNGQDLLPLHHPLGHLGLEIAEKGMKH